MGEIIKAIRVIGGSVIEEKTISVIEMGNDVSDLFNQFDDDGDFVFGEIWHIRNKDFMIFYKPYRRRFGKSISNCFYSKHFLDERDIYGDAIIVNTNENNDILTLKESDILLVSDYPSLTFKLDPEDFLVKFFVSGYYIEDRIKYQKLERDDGKVFYLH